MGGLAEALPTLTGHDNHARGIHELTYHGHTYHPATLTETIQTSYGQYHRKDDQFYARYTYVPSDGAPRLDRR